MTYNNLSRLARTGLLTAYRVSGRESDQPFEAWYRATANEPDGMALTIYLLLEEVIHAPYFSGLPDFECEIIRLAFDVSDFAVVVCWPTAVSVSSGDRRSLIQ